MIGLPKPSLTGLLSSLLISPTPSLSSYMNPSEPPGLVWENCRVFNCYGALGPTGISIPGAIFPTFVTEGNNPGYSISGVILASSSSPLLYLSLPLYLMSDRFLYTLRKPLGLLLLSLESVNTILAKYFAFILHFPLTQSEHL